MTDVQAMTDVKEMTDVQSLASQYQKKNEKQHILDAPDTYIGSVEKSEKDLYVMNDETSISLINTDKIRKKCN